ncbi:MAG: PD-(D/E)XK motif protein [Chloroflexi bacterium]|nr:PD-(D/E)XK motif protein [Chloroflexota bacterium]
MTASELLLQTWELVQAEGNESPGYYHRRIPLDCTFPAYAGIVRPECNRRLSLLVDQVALRTIPLRDETRGYTVEVEPSPAGHGDHAFIHITAKGTAFAEVFAIVGADILEQWIPQHQATAAVTLVYRRLLHWRRFFQRGSGGLSREEYVGLYTELIYLEALLEAGLAPDHCVEAWQGPLGTNQDYVFGPLAVEVKGSTGNEVGTVKVANERQLDSVGLQALFLFHAVFDFREKSGRTLKQLVAALAERLRASSQPALLLLEERLLSAGYTAHVPSAYDDYGFTERKRESYEVREGFPRIVESDLAAGVAEVLYRVNLTACLDFQVPVAAIIQAVRGGE